MVGLAVALVEATGGRGAHQSRPQSSSAVQPSSAGDSQHAQVQTGRAVQTSRAGQSQRAGGLPEPGQSATSGGWSLIATTKGAISRYASPGGPQDGTIPASWYGAVSALPVIAQQPGWLEVRLAGRPNGSTGWVRQADVSVTATPYWISVDLATRHVALFRLDQQVMDAPAGRWHRPGSHPDRAVLRGLLRSIPEPRLRPVHLVTSAHSTSIANWEGSGDAVIGIHGPLGADSLIGTTGAYLSHGCIRIPIPDLVQLRDVPAGSPISICG